VEPVSLSKPGKLLCPAWRGRRLWLNAGGRVVRQEKREKNQVLGQPIWWTKAFLAVS
jgi:hypothetical protein